MRNLSITKKGNNKPQIEVANEVWMLQELPMRKMELTIIIDYRDAAAQTNERESDAQDPRKAESFL